MRILFLLLSLFLSAAAYSDERILSFHSDLRVFSDGMIEVTETIRVQAEGKQIRRGIYRDFPGEYEDRLGKSYEITGDAEHHEKTMASLADPSGACFIRWATKLA